VEPKVPPKIEILHNDIITIMNSIRQALTRSLGLAPFRGMSFNAHIGPLRYGSLKVIDYTGKCYLIPYSCSVYIDDIDGMLSNIIRDIPPEDYQCSAHIVEVILNRQLTKLYKLDYNVKLHPPAKNMLPPCHNLY